MQRILMLGLAASTFYISACASDRLITIDSSPQGADVIADGKKIGVTPMRIIPDDVFPPRWIGASYMVKGNLELIKQDCEPLSMEVNDAVLSKPVNKELKCAQQGSVAPAAAAEVGSPPEKKLNTNVEQRLEKLKGLHDKGLVTDQEYETQRQRILNEL